MGTESTTSRADTRRRAAAWLAAEVALAARLTDADRIRILRDLLRTAAAIQRTKSAEQLAREDAVRRALETEPGRARYRAAVSRLA